MRRFGLALAVMLAAIGGPAGAQEPTDPATRIAAEIDRYLQNPRSAETYRALANLADPNFLADGRHDRWSWESPLLAALDMSYTNCRWRYSDQIYRQRIARLGEKHPYVSHWLKVQRAVFSRCHGYEDRAGDPIPPPLQAGDDRTARLQVEDRAYQQAAALFYEKRQAEARAAFAAIAARPGDHRAAAKLMVASIDAGSEPGFSGDAKPGATAIAKAERLISDPAAKSMQANAHELVGWIGATADTREARRAQVKVTLEALALPIDTIRSDPQAEARYHRSSEDLLKLFTDFKEQDWWLSGAVPDGYYGSLAMAEAARSNPLVAFALTQRPRPDEPSTGWKVREAAGEQLAANRNDRDAWRVVLLQLGRNYDQPGTNWAEIDELLARVAARPTDHDVALLGFLFDYQLRQSLSGSGYYGYDAIEDRQERQVAMTRLAAYPYKRSEHFGRLYSHALNSFILFKDIETARRLRDLVEPQLDEAGYSWLVDSDLLLLLAEDEAAMVKVIADRRAGDSTLLNRLPAQELARLAQDDRIDAKVRKRFARVAWTRHFVLGGKIPKGLDAAMRSLNPQIAAKWRSRPGSQPRDHALLLDVLGTPGMNLRIESRTEPDSNPLEIDVYAHSLNNWWCVPDAVEQTGREEDELAHSVDQTPRGTLEALLAKSYLWQSLDRRERDALSAVPKGPQLLSDAAIGWGKKASAKRPKGADEALALAVRSTRYGCQMNGGHGAYSKAAWDLLHRKFPDSPAARRTRWWFDCRHFTYGCTDSRKDDQPFGTIEAYEAWEAEEKRQREPPQE